MDDIEWCEAVTEYWLILFETAELDQCENHEKSEGNIV